MRALLEARGRRLSSMMASRNQNLRQLPLQSREELTRRRTRRRWVREVAVTPTASLSQKIKEPHRRASARRAKDFNQDKSDVEQETAEHLRDSLNRHRRQEKIDSCCTVKMVQMQAARRNQTQRCGRYYLGPWTRMLRLHRTSSKKLSQKPALNIQAPSRNHVAASSMVNSLALPRIWAPDSSKWMQTS